MGFPRGRKVVSIRLRYVKDGSNTARHVSGCSSAELLSGLHEKFYALITDSGRLPCLVLVGKRRVFERFHYECSNRSQ